MQKINYVYVLNADGQPLMPTHRFGMVNRWLKTGQAHWVGNSRNTIQFDRPVGSQVQTCVEGVDAGAHLGISVVDTDTNRELYAGLSLRDYKGEVKRNVARRMYRRTRRNRLRHRKARFDNRRKPDSWLAPSIRYQVEFIEREIKLVQKFLPIKRVIVEDAPFDIAKLTNDKQRSSNYIKGRLYGYDSVKDYLYDEQNGIDPIDGKHYAKSQMVVHHLIYRSQGGTNSPDNLVLLSVKNHTTANHNNGVLEQLAKNYKQTTDTRGAFLMNVLHVRLPKLLNNKPLLFTYGYKTAHKLKMYGMRKDRSKEYNHVQDAFLIANGNDQTLRFDYYYYREKRHRNNRSLQKFYDAKYLDTRDGQKKSGKELSSGRNRRSLEIDYNDQRPFRGTKVRKGRVSIRRQHYQIQPHDLVKVNDHEVFEAKGVHCNGNSVTLITNSKANKKRDFSLRKYSLKVVYYLNSFIKEKRTRG